MDDTIWGANDEQLLCLFTQERIFMTGDVEDFVKQCGLDPQMEAFDDDGRPVESRLKIINYIVASRLARI